MSHSYERLNTGQDLPSQPPAYDGSGVPDNSDIALGPPIEQFEIDDDEVFEPLKRETFIKRIGFVSKKFAFNFRDRVVEPLCRMFIPLYEGYVYFSQRWESSLLKLGNPLVVKRLLYVLFAVILVFVVMEYDNNDGVNGASGGAFSSGKFFDRERLANTLADYIEPRALQENLEYLSSMPHMAGTKGDLALAKYVESYFSNNGISDIDFNEVGSFLNFPTGDSYVRLSDGSYSARLYDDKDGSQSQHLAFNPSALNTEQELDLPYIYVNEGTFEDFKKLSDAHVDIKDSIVLIKYGGNVPEPNKVLAAQRLGAKAVVFITPEVTFTGKNLGDAIKKANVALTRVSPGDILDSGRSSQGGYIASKGWDSAPATPKIPTIPISWTDGKHFIEKLGKTGVDFGNGLHSGALEKNPKLRLNVRNTERVGHPIWNVVGFIPGREQPDKGIIIGAGRDSSCYGAMTSASGTAVLLELVKIFSGLQRRYNWTPSRSIYFVSFDGTENNLAGAAEWVHSRKKSLLSEGYSYIDLNSIVSGDTLLVKSHPLLNEVIKEALKKTSLTSEQKEKYPNAKTLYDLFRAQNDNNDKILNNMLKSANYVPFINEINLPSMEIQFRGDDFVEGTCLDTFQVFSERGFDPLMKKHKQVTELIARVALELAESPIIPFDFVGLSSRLKEYQKDLESFIEAMISESPSTAHPVMSYDGMTRAIERLKLDSNQLNELKKNWEQYTAASAIEPPVFAATRKQLNLKMVSFGGVFLNNDNQLSREGFANYLLGVAYNAPVQENDKYEWNTFPMIRDLAAEGQFGNAQFEINRLASLISTAREVISPMF